MQRYLPTVLPTGLIMHFPTLDAGRHDFDVILIQMMPWVIEALVTFLRQSFYGGTQKKGNVCNIGDGYMRLHI